LVLLLFIAPAGAVQAQDSAASPYAAPSPELSSAAKDQLPAKLADRAQLEAAKAARSIESDSIVVPDGIPFRIQLVDGFSSATAKVGDTIKFTVAESVWFDGIAIVPKDMPLTGKVISVDPPRRGGRDGRVAIAFDGFKLPTGESASMRAMLKPRTAGEKTKSDLNKTAILATDTVMFAPGVVAIPFIKGTEETVPAGTDEVVYLDGPLNLNRKAASELKPPPDAGLAHIYYLDARYGFARTLYCGQESLGELVFAKTYNFTIRPGTYWFSVSQKNGPATKIEALAGHEYFIEKEHGVVVEKDFQQNQARLYKQKLGFTTHDLSTLPDNELRALAAEPVAQPQH
jgi:hypothetical protein